MRLFSLRNENISRPNEKFSRTNVICFLQQTRIFLVWKRIFLQWTRKFLVRKRTFLAQTRKFLEQRRLFVEQTRILLVRMRFFLKWTRIFLVRTRIFRVRTRTFLVRVRFFLEWTRIFLIQMRIFLEQTRIFMPPATKKLRRHIGLGLCVRWSHFAYGQERLEIGSWNLICGISMKNRDPYFFFFSVGLFVAELCPFFDVSFWFCHYKPMNLVNKISGEPLELGSWYLANRLCPTNWIISPFRFWHFVVKQSYQQNIWRTAWARIMASVIQFRYMM